MAEARDCKNGSQQTHRYRNPANARLGMGVKLLSVVILSCIMRRPGMKVVVALNQPTHNQCNTNRQYKGQNNHQQYLKVAQSPLTISRLETQFFLKAQA
jgi:hypothetical protein